ncbi:uncharacterized protein F5147DRAFT_121569 [Suillus discolor]|uniref:DUF6533 domain-containing protein n=1 Tax=Suillus discolor TaxID=1912936 RepID=A0A9P7FM18_9AGAM|nr:uncharacterized protein F5147DRAFT_121569 [Suillus discolor]KAG2119778.1 hypothetical protein F5147DRAFT_121569 [Suillus discolor]
MVAPRENIGIQTAKYFNVAGLGVLIFDYFLTLEPEIRWTWNRRWNVARVLFVISRYMAFVAAAMTSYAVLATRANQNCTNFSRASNAIHIISIVAAEGLLIIRTYAFWKQSKKLLAVLLVLAAICIACGVGLADFVGGLLDALASPLAPTTSNCNFETNRGSAIQYGFLVAYELLLMSLTVFKRYEYYRDCNGRLVRAIFQGGVRYMTAIIFVSVVNIVITSAVPLSYSEMMDLPQVVLHSMLASRVLFSLRESDQNALDLVTLQMSTFRPAQ